MTVKITWVKDKGLNCMDRSIQTKTFDSEEKAIEWCRRNSAHILRINNSEMFFEDVISHFGIMNALRNK